MSKTPKAKTKKADAKGKSAAQVKKTAAKKTTPPAEGLGEQQTMGLAALSSEQLQNSIGAGSKKFIVVAFVALFIVGGYFSWPFLSFAIAPYFPIQQWGTKVQPSAPKPLPKKIVSISSERLTEERRQLNKSIGRLMDRMKAIEMAIEEIKKLAQATTTPLKKLVDTPEINNLTGRLDTLEKNDVAIKTILKRMKKIKDEEVRRTKIHVDTQDEVQRKLADVPPDQKVTTENNAATLIIAVENLRRAIATNESFNKPLETLKIMASGNLTINTAVVLLAKNAATGISTLPELKQRFHKIAGEIVHASRITNKPGWQARIITRLSSLAMWRKIDGKENNASIDAIVASAESEIKAGNLNTAISILEGLSINNKAATVAKTWLTDAKNRIVTVRAINSLHNHAISELITIKPSEDHLRW